MKRFRHNRTLKNHGFIAKKLSSIDGKIWSESSSKICLRLCISSTGLPLSKHTYTHSHTCIVCVVSFIRINNMQYFNCQLSSKHIHIHTHTDTRAKVHGPVVLLLCCLKYCHKVNIIVQRILRKSCIHTFRSHWIWYKDTNTIDCRR